ncbi:DUF1249 domain-containing protein [Tamilnaduibacter salinus]|nr:DUF1249 domain-containing protein [Tamilnaduibacter salinus]
MKEAVMRRRYVPDLQRFNALCEGNYRRLVQLRRLAASDGHHATFELRDRDAYFGRVHIERQQKSRYTETLLLEQIHNSGRWLNDPHLTVRVYHDAGLAEVVSCYRDYRIQAVNDYPNRSMHHPDEKAQVNAFLADWLAFCLRFGHVAAEEIAWPV